MSQKGGRMSKKGRNSHDVLVRALGTSWDRGFRRFSLVRLCLETPAVKVT